VGAFVVVGGALALRQVGGHGTVTVPDEHGRTRDAAVAAVTAAGLLPQVTTAASADGAPAGTVIAQVPAPGTGVRPGRTVVLTLAPSATAAPR
jgi:beta-lactam-binding protein with PASTA domain